MAELAHELDVRLTSHEAVCAERYKALDEKIGNVQKDVSTISKILLTVAATIGLELLGAVTFFVAKGLN